MYSLVSGDQKSKLKMSEGGLPFLLLQSLASCCVASVSASVPCGPASSLPHPSLCLSPSRTFDVGSVPTWIIQASLIAQTVKDQPAIQETRVRVLDWENPLE